MADRKEPPFFNDESVGAFQYKLPFYDTMELYIETLTGTCFELRVLPFEAVVSVKAKIQRLEGIPVAQQHLIWNNVELDDEHCLHDYGIAEGCTLKLVLAMRGGPINTRKVTMEEPAKDVAELMEATKEEGWDKSASNKQVTFVVYREGDQLNFFRVVDRGDGTLTPLSESTSAGSVYNVYTEEEDGESAAAQHSWENSITMSKMKLLKAKMEDMNLNKKPKKSAKVKPRPPATPHPGTQSLTSSSAPRHHPHRLFRSLSHIHPTRPTSSHLPPIQDQDPLDLYPPSTALASPSSHLPLPRHPPATFTSPSCYMLHEEQWDTCPPLANIRPPPKVSRLDMGGRLMRDCVYPQLPPLCTRGAPEVILDPGENLGEVLGLSLLEETAGLVAPKQASFAELSDPLTLDVSSPQDGGIQMSPSPLSTWTLETRERTSFRISPSSPLPTTSTSPNASSRIFETQTLVKPVSPLPPRLRAVKVESPGRRPEMISKREARGITRMANQARKEPVGSLSQSELMATLSTRALQGGSSGNGGSSSREKLSLGTGPRLPTLSTRLHQEAALRQALPLHRSGTTLMASSSHTSAAGVLTSLGRIGSLSQPLPPLRASSGPKKKSSSSSKHCFLCGKKTGLASSYDCRCGQNFCATHRYAETHACTYDYKTEGRRMLQECNPLISAPKLPKI
ncbi:AN1-type zinc finger protein 4 [Eucyclogobius newberryi]|uniref:AN1-type zinc finger protein 4 n=1 Tax=Eucyclogobius newberryi TaxID=166745 RepID=UPI003B5991B9